MKKTGIILLLTAASMFKTSCGEDVIYPVPQPPVKEEFKMSEAPKHVPVIEIMTDRQADIVSKEEYLRAHNHKGKQSGDASGLRKCKGKGKLHLGRLSQEAI